MENLKLVQLIQNAKQLLNKSPIWDFLERKKYGKSQYYWWWISRSGSGTSVDLRQIPVRLYEMRPHKTTGAHKTEYFAELVCSNSLRADGLNNAVGVLKKRDGNE